MAMTASEFQQQKTYQRALEGELAKTIGAIDGVDAATVHLAMPEETVFVADEGGPDRVGVRADHAPAPR